MPKVRKIVQTYHQVDIYEYLQSQEPLFDDGQPEPASSAVVHLTRPVVDVSPLPSQVLQVPEVVRVVAGARPRRHIT